MAEMAASIPFAETIESAERIEASCYHHGVGTWRCASCAGWNRSKFRDVPLRARCVHCQRINYNDSVMRLYDPDCPPRT